MNNYIYEDELYHHGIRGQKWGNRRYQNSDGSLTEAGKKRYGYGEKRGTFRNELKRQKAFNDMRKIDEKTEKAAEKLKRKASTNEAFKSKYEEAEKMRQQASKRMDAGLKALDMRDAEINYRDAYRDYMKFSRRNTLLFGAPISVIIDSTTKKGKELTKNLVVTSEQYKHERN